MAAPTERSSITRSPSNFHEFILWARWLWSLLTKQNYRMPGGRWAVRSSEIAGMASCSGAQGSRRALTVRGIWAALCLRAAQSDLEWTRVAGTSDHQVLPRPTGLAEWASTDEHEDHAVTSHETMVLFWWRRVKFSCPE